MCCLVIIKVIKEKMEAFFNVMLRLDAALFKRHGNRFTSSWSKMGSRTGFLCSKLSVWCSKIKESSAHGKWREVLSGFSEMQRAGAQLNDPFLFPIIVKACAKLSWLFQGRLIHASLIKKGLDSSVSIGNSIAAFYMKCGDLCSAMDEFDSMSSRDSISWNIIVFGLLDRGFAEDGLWWFWKCRVSGFEPNVSTLILVIHACRTVGAFFEGEKVHGYVIRSGFSAVPSVQNSILSTYAEADTESARKLFDEMPDRDVISWSVIIRSYVQSQEALLGLQLFLEMVHEAEIEPDGTTMTSALKACTVLEDIDMGRSLHGLVIRKGYALVDVFVWNSLIDMYSKCHDAASAFGVFNEMTHRNIVSWNSIVSTLVHNQTYHEALALFHLMGNEGIDVDEVTLVSLLRICKFLGQPLPCRSIHCVIIRHGYETNELALSSLVDSYTKCNLIDQARTVFAMMKKRDVVSWSAMISGLALAGRPDEAISVFHEMNVKPNAVTITNLLDACSVSADLRKSKWAHGFAIRRGVATIDVSVGTAIVETYSKCGAIDDARRAFDQIPIKNVVSWTTIISAYAMNGQPHEALASFEEMKRQHIRPNSTTYLAALSACSHGGLIKGGLAILESIVQDGEDEQLKPSLQHYSCIIDMLSRAGEVETAMELIKNLPEEIKIGASAWGAILSGCRSHGKSEIISSEAVAEIVELDPLCSSGYMLASSVFASRKRWDDVAKMRRLAKERRVKVVAGYSLVHVGNLARRFLAGEEKGRQSECELNGVVQRLHRCMKMEEIGDEGEL